MSDRERVRLFGTGINLVIEVPRGADSYEHEGQLFQRTGTAHSVGADQPIPSFHAVAEDG